MKGILKTAAVLWAGAGLFEFVAADATGSWVGRLAEASEMDRLWSVPAIYQDEAGPLLQELALQGSLQTQYAYGSDDSGNYGSGDMPENCTWGDTEVRRFRLGLKARLFEHLKFHSLLDLYPDISPRVYKRTAEAYFTWTFADAFNVSAGKTELKFSREQEISSRDLLVFERSQLVNQLYGGELTGAWICGKNIGGGWLYEIGAYSNDRSDELSGLEGGTMILSKIGCNYTKLTTFDSALAQIHHLHNTDPGYVSTGNPASPSYSDSFAISNELTKGPYGLTTEIFWADGAKGHPDIFGITAMPTYSFTKELQLITTFQLATSPQENGMSLPTRYEGQTPGAGDQSGDLYFAGYAGLNYYFHGQKLKAMSGVKYTGMDGGAGGGDFNGWTFLSGLRMAF